MHNPEMRKTGKNSSCHCHLYLNVPTLHFTCLSMINMASVSIWPDDATSSEWPQNWTALQEYCLKVTWLNDFQKSPDPFSTTALHKRYPITGPDRPWGFQEVEAPRFQDNRHMKVVRLSAPCGGRLYPQEVFLVLISVRGWVDPGALVRPGLCQRKIPMTPSGIEPATILVVAQCLDQLRYGMPPPLVLYSTLLVPY